jgi:hypothetical protein
MKTKRPDAEHQKLQNKHKFIKIGSLEAEIALKVRKIIILHYL